MSLALPPDTLAHQEAIGTLLGEFANHFRYDVPEHWADLWWTEFEKVPIETLHRARDAFFASGEAWPAGNRFKPYVEEAKEFMRRQSTGTGTCCDRGWVHTAGAVQPCRHCRPEQHETWKRSWAPASRKLEHIQPDTILSYNPAAMVAEAKRLLHADDRRHP